MSESTYQRRATLQGSQDAILSVAFSPDGKFVAAAGELICCRLNSNDCAGYSGVFVWNLSTNNLVTVPEVPYNPRQTKYVFAALSWLSFETNGRLVILLGSLRGDLLAWDWDAGDKARACHHLSIILSDLNLQAFKPLHQISPQTKDMGILAIDVYQEQVASRRQGYIAVAAADRSVRVFSLLASGEWDTVFSITLEEGFLPKAVRFRKGTRVLFAFSRTGGGMYVNFLC